MEWSTGQVLFYGGFIGVIISAAAAFVTFMILRKSDEQLQEELDREYGKHKTL